MAKRINFFATRNDMVLLLKELEISFEVKYVLSYDTMVISNKILEYSFGKYIFTKKDADSLLNKIAAIKYASETKCAVHPVLITPYGLAEGVNTGLIQAVIEADDLFVKMV